MLTEGVVCVDDAEAACIPTDLSVFCMPVPESLCDEEVVVFNLSSEWCRWNVENSLTSVEVMKISGDLVAGNFPRCVLLVGVEWVFEISPGIIESLDRVEVLLLTHGDD
jgi:hypothetical protein